ncbi:MAG: hypothetical protein JSS14_16410 [Proteobacteria bacterium]|nr:hypothetical protein [Pseudomonadota bacterium]
MNKKQVRAHARFALNRGITRTEVFSHLRGRGLKDKQLAYFIASHVDPASRLLNAGKVKVLVALMVVLAAVGFVAGMGLGAKFGPNAKWLVAGGIALVSLLFAWGFHAHRVGAYNAYILLAIVQLPRSLDGFTADPFATSIGFVVNVALLAYVWYVRQCLFPDFTFLAPRKVKGEYVFSA